MKNALHSLCIIMISKQRIYLFINMSGREYVQNRAVMSFEAFSVTQEQPLLMSQGSQSRPSQAHDNAEMGRARAPSDIMRLLPQRLSEQVSTQAATSLFINNILSSCHSRLSINWYIHMIWENLIELAQCCIDSAGDWVTLSRRVFWANITADFQAQSRKIFKCCQEQMSDLIKTQQTWLALHKTDTEKDEEEWDQLINSWIEILNNCAQSQQESTSIREAEVV